MPVRFALVLAIALAGCAGPASSSTEPVPTSAPASADVREIKIAVSGLI